MAWAEAYLCTKWHLDPSSRLATTDGQKLGGGCASWGSGSPANTMWPGQRPTSVPTGILTHHAFGHDMGRKLGAAVFFRAEVGPHVTQCGLGRGLPSYQVASQSMQPFGHNTWAEVGGCCAPPFLGRAGSPCNTMSPRSRSTSVPSGILIHLAIWPQQTWAEYWGLCLF